MLSNKTLCSDGNSLHLSYPTGLLESTDYRPEVKETKSSSTAMLATMSYWALEMCLVKLRNWILFNVFKDLFFGVLGLQQDWEERRDFPHTLCPPPTHTQPPPLSTSPCHNGWSHMGASSSPEEHRWHRGSLWMLYIQIWGMGLEKGIMLHSHHYTIPQNGFTA